MLHPVYIVDYKRTPFGAFCGSLSAKSACELAAHCIRPMLTHLPAPLQPDLLIVGQALPAGSGQSPSTAILLKHLRLPHNLASYSVNKVCSSGMRAVMSACDAIQLGRHKMALAGGTDSMSSCPHYYGSARKGQRFGDVTVVDGVDFDGLRDAVYGVRMGECGDMLAADHHIDRLEQDRLARSSFDKAIASQSHLEGEMVPFEGLLASDEQLSRYNPDKMATLRPAFTATGTITAANSSPMSDGAAFLLLTDHDTVTTSSSNTNIIRPMARIIGYADATIDDPRRFPLAMVPAIQAALQDANITIDMVSRFELSEAFALVPKLVATDLQIDPDRVNVWGGAVSLGHPLGATGARLVGTLARQLADCGGQYGVAAVCNGGGGASAMVLERQ